MVSSPGKSNDEGAEGATFGFGFNVLAESSKSTLAFLIVIFKPLESNQDSEPAVWAFVLSPEDSAVLCESTIARSDTHEHLGIISALSETFH